MKCRNASCWDWVSVADAVAVADFDFFFGLFFLVPPKDLGVRAFAFTGRNG